MLFRDREPVTSFSLGNVDIGDEAGTSGPGYVSPLLQGNTGDYITPLISSNRDIELQEVQEEVQEEYRTPLISRTRDIEIYTQQPYSGQYSTVQYSTVQYSAVQHSTALYSIENFSTVQYSTIQYSTVQYSVEIPIKTL